MSEQEEILRKEFGKLLSDDYCYLSHSFKVDGNLYSPTSVMLEGVIEGDLFSEGNVFIEEGAVVNGNVSGDNVVVYGTVRGSIAAREKLGLHKNACVEGNVASKNCVISGEVSLSGQVSFSKENEVDTSFEYPEIKVKPPKVKTTGVQKIKNKNQKAKKESEDLLLPLYPEMKDDNLKSIKQKSKDSEIPNGTENSVKGKKQDSSKQKQTSDKGKSRIDLLDSDHSLW